VRPNEFPNLAGLCDRALIGAMIYSFARVTAAISTQVEDYSQQKRHGWLRLHEKAGKVGEVPCHPRLAVYLDDYLDAAGCEMNAGRYYSVRWPRIAWP